MTFLLLIVKHARSVDEHDALNEIVIKSVEVRHRAEIEEIQMTGAEALIAKGRIEGRQEGRQEGRVENARETLVIILTQRFGVAQETIAPRVAAVPDRELTGLTVQALKAEQLSDLNL